MSKKKTQIDRAIDQCELEISVLRATIAKLREQQTKAPVRRPRAAIAPEGGAR